GQGQARPARPERRVDPRPVGDAPGRDRARGGEGDARRGAAHLTRPRQTLRAPGKDTHTMEPTHAEVGLYIFILAGFLGYHVISRVPPLLHTPLMSATNAISGISLIGSLVVVGEMHDWLSTLLGFVAVGCSTPHVVGGFLITDRMLAMFKSEREVKSAGLLSERAFLVIGVSLLVVGTVGFGWGVRAGVIHPEQVLRYLYIVSAILF